MRSSASSRSRVQCSSRCVLTPDSGARREPASGRKPAAPREGVARTGSLYNADCAPGRAAATSARLAAAGAEARRTTTGNARRCRAALRCCTHARRAGRRAPADPGGFTVVRPQVRPALLPEPTVASGVGGAVRPAERATWCGAQRLARRPTPSHGGAARRPAPRGEARVVRAPAPRRATCTRRPPRPPAAVRISCACIPSCLKGAIGKLKLCIAHGGGKALRGSAGATRQRKGRSPSARPTAGGGVVNFLDVSRHPNPALRPCEVASERTLGMA